VLVADDNEVMHIPYRVKIFRLNPFDWWAGYDLKSVQLAYLRETGAAKEAFYEEEELAQDSMQTFRVYDYDILACANLPQRMVAWPASSWYLS
jgi:hypothetical protein